MKYTAYNKRFGVMAAVSPQKRKCVNESLYPAETLVKPPLRQATGRCVQFGRLRNGTMK